MFPKFPFSAHRNHRLADHDSPSRGKARARVAFRAGLEALEGRELMATALYPDLVPWVDKKQGFLYDWSIDKTTMPGHTLLRVTTTTGNTGQGPLDMVGTNTFNPDGSVAVDQVIHYSDGTTSTVLLSDGFIFDADHQHVHYEWLNTYNLRAVNADGSPGPIVATNAKVSFCLEDDHAMNLSLPGAPASPVFTTCGYTRQGLSVGWADTYHKSLYSQWIDVTGVPNGKYYLEQVVNPDHVIYESNYGNNAADILINLNTNGNHP